MLRRKAMANLLDWHKNSPRKALLVDGARQVGKTYLIRTFAKENYKHFVEINLLEVEGAAQAFNSATNSTDLFSRITLYANDEMVPGETVIFIDEVQESPEMITAAKFLVDKTGDNYRYIFSGSMLGVELKGIKSWPVGYMREIKMYPLDFEEFCWANGVAQSILDQVKHAWNSLVPIDDYIHSKLLEIFYYYLAVGGMPEAVSEYISSKNLQTVRSAQADILELYRYDISKYCNDDTLLVKSIFDNIPAELNQQNKRFVATNIDKNVRISREENKFLWLVDAGVAIPEYNVDEPRFPLEMSKNSTLFKLFMNDVGLLACASGMDTVRKLMNREPVNYGAIYENFVAQSLLSCGFRLYYFKNKKLGELDFLLEWNGGVVVPVEVKSGKGYKRHVALNNVMETPNYNLKQSVVLYDGNINKQDKVVYLPIYCVGLFCKDDYPAWLIAN